MACGSIRADRLRDRQIRRQVYTGTARRLNRTVAGLVIQPSVVELDSRRRTGRARADTADGALPPAGHRHLQPRKQRHPHRAGAVKRPSPQARRQPPGRQEQVPCITTVRVRGIRVMGVGQAFGLPVSVSQETAGSKPALETMLHRCCYNEFQLVLVVWEVKFPCSEVAFLCL